MPSWLNYILQMLAFAIIIIAVYNFLRKYVLFKVKVNKWIVLSVAIVFFLLGSFIPQIGLVKFITPGIFVILLLWFFDLSGWGAAGYKKKLQQKNEVVIKPKAKPNRVKNNK